MLLQGKTALITGTSIGIGRAMLEIFAQHGAQFWACARSPEDSFAGNCQALADKYQTNIWPLYFDMTDEAGMKETIKKSRCKKSASIY